MIKSSFIWWQCALLFFSSFPSISETNAGIEFTLDQLHDYIRSGKDYNKISEDLIHRFHEALDMVESPEERSKILELVGKRLDNIFSLGNKLAKSTKEETAFSIKTARQKIGLMVQFDVASAVVETGLMIRSLFKTYNTINRSEKFRQSSLQQEITKIIQHLDRAEEFYRIATKELDQIEKTTNMFIQENILEKIALNLDRANLECEYVQQILRSILADIDQKMKELLSAQKSHTDGFRSSLLRLVFTSIEYALKPASGLTKLAKYFLLQVHACKLVMPLVIL